MKDAPDVQSARLLRLNWVNRKAVLWAVQLFSKSCILASGIWLGLYAISLIVLGSPEPVSESTMEVVAIMLQRVVLLEEQVGLWMAIFILNTIVAVFASLAGALLILTLPLEATDIRYRQAHPTYARFAKHLDRVGYWLLWKNLIKVAQRVDAVGRQRQTGISDSHSLGFWNLVGYSGSDFQKMFSVLPFLIPALTAIVNGIVFGMVLTVTLMQGAYAGFLIGGGAGVFIGFAQQSLHFLAFTMPHGVLELAVIFSAIAVGYSFADQFAQQLLSQRLLIDPRLEVFEKNLICLVTVAKQFLRSKTLLSTLLLFTGVLCLAAYIEVYITPNIAESVVLIFD
jgi:uncharacterized membrane protein SpoIIM required for sporulation